MSADSTGGTTSKWIVYLGVAASVATVIGTIIAYLAYVKPNPSTPPNQNITPVVVVATPPPTATPIPTATPVPVATPIPTDTPVPTATPIPQPTIQSPYGATPSETMNAFCTDLYNQDYQDAFTLLSTSIQNYYGTESNFAKRYYLARCGQNYGYTPHGNGQQFAVYILYPSQTYLCTYYLIQIVRRIGTR